MRSCRVLRAFFIVLCTSHTWWLYFDVRIDEKIATDHRNPFPMIPTFFLSFVTFSFHWCGFCFRQIYYSSPVAKLMIDGLHYYANFRNANSMLLTSIYNLSVHNLKVVILFSTFELYYIQFSSIMYKIYLQWVEWSCEHYDEMKMFQLNQILRICIIKVAVSDEKLWRS